MANRQSTRVQSQNQFKVGQRFGRWTVIGPMSKHGRKYRVPCRCDCGIKRYVEFYHLLAGRSKSCGCLRSDVMAERNRIHSDTERGHIHRLFKIWDGMRQRCNNPNSPAYGDYGGRGIAVCKEWQKDYRVFRRWALANGYADGLRLDRIDNDGNYEPGNCRWATQTEQNRNRRFNRLLTAYGETKCIAEWAEDGRCVVKYATLQGRLARGWPLERALTTEALHG